jgi:hypothetical protein
MSSMAWEVEYTDEFESWWEDLTAAAQIDVDTVYQQGRL